MVRSLRVWVLPRLVTLPAPSPPTQPAAGMGRLGRLPSCSRLFAWDLEQRNCRKASKKPALENQLSVGSPTHYAQTRAGDPSPGLSSRHIAIPALTVWRLRRRDRDKERETKQKQKEGTQGKSAPHSAPQIFSTMHCSGKSVVFSSS